MVDTLPNNLQQVYAKWEGNNPYNRSGPGSHGNRPPSLRMNQMSNSDYGAMMSQGRDAWRNQYKSANPKIPVRRHRSAHNKGGIPTVSMSQVVSNNLAPFKSSPTAFPAGKLRPFTGRCCNCMPNSRNTFFHDDYRDSGFCNILQLDTRSEKNGWFTRTFSTYSHVMRKNMDYKYPNVAKPVLTSPRLLEAVSKTVKEDTESAKDSPKLPQLVRKKEKSVLSRARYLVTRMKAVISVRLLRFTTWFLHHLLSRLLSSIVVHKGQMEMIKQACQRDVPVIFLPTHRSHLDYILITFILVNHSIMAPHVAAGDNLLIPIFGALMRGLGGYFIRRKLDKRGKKDHVYRAILQTYMNELLRRHQNFEFFVEGGRTRSGKAIYPKGGLLSVIVDAFNENVISDAYIVPISISYDKILDGHFCREQMGEPKQSETFWRAVLAIWKVIKTHYGSVRVDFSQPFSLREYIQVSQGYRHASLNGLVCEGSPGSDSPTTPDSVMKISASEMSIYGTDIVVEEQRQMIQGLAEHIISEQSRVGAAMCTHMTSLLLLNKHRQGVPMKVLIEDFDWLKQEILSRGRDLGFSGNSPDVVSHALSLLGDHLVIKRPMTEEERSQSNNAEKNKNEKNNYGDVENMIVQPTVSLPNVFELSYYANVTNSVFVVESAIANALYGLVDKDKWLSPNDTKILVSQQRLLDSADVICRYLKYEYIFSPPCTPVEHTLGDAFDQFTCSEILQRAEEDEGCVDSRERDWARRLDKSLSFGAEEESDEEDWVPADVFYEVNKNEDYCMSKLRFLRDILSPILETYYVAACNLTTLLRQDRPEEDYIKIVHKQLKDRVKSGVASYEESASLDTVKNTIRSFQHNKVISCYQVANIRMISLKHQYQNDETLHKFIEGFESYRN